MMAARAVSVGILDARQVCALILALAPTLACTAGTTSNNCALNTCTSSAVLKIFANLPRDAMAEATVTACRDQTCVSGQPTSIPSSPGDRLTIALQGALTVNGFISSPDPTRGYIIEADFNLSDSAPASNDTYQLYVTSAGTQVSGGINQAATYTTTTPNGANCPPVCQSAIIDQTK